MLGRGAFLRLYFIGGIVAGILALLSMKLSGQNVMLTGFASTLLILFTLWSMAFPETEILLLFLIPVKVKWIVASLVGILLLISLSHWNLSQFTLYLSAVVIGYVYAVVVHGWYSPFPFTLKFDIWLSRLAGNIRKRMPFPKRKPEEIKTPKAKIIDIITGQSIEDDDAFVDAMLTKISKRGEESLSWAERKRLQDISKKKMH
jgi:hypothetical protein